MRVLATAGHVDHGKSTLVRALTGMEPDRWAEERRRGMTIDLGYAWLTTAAGEQLAFVDVPGHQRFIGNMLAGLGPAPAVLFVVAADEGWSRQSEDHLAAIDALRIEHGVLAVTRSDLADPAATLADSRTRLAQSSLGAVEAVAVSGSTGAGIPDLLATLDRLVTRLPTPDPDAPMRLWIDRVFTVRGSGTVVTGTLAGGTIGIADQVEVAGQRVTVRGMQCLGAPRDQVSAPARVAVNLRGVDHDQLSRGDVLVTPGAWPWTDTVDARLHGVDHAVGGSEQRRLPEQLTMHLGTLAVPVRLRRLGSAGEDVLVRIQLPRPVAVRAGDRAVLRDPGRHAVAGGVVVLDADPPALSRRGAAAARATELSHLSGAIDSAREIARRTVMRRDDLRRLGGDAPPGAREVDGWLIDDAAWHGWIERAPQVVREWAEHDPVNPAMPIGALRRALDTPSDAVTSAVAAARTLTVRDGRVELPGARAESLGPAEDAVRTLQARLRADPFAAPEANELAQLSLGRRELAAAERAGRLVRVSDQIVLAPEAFDEAMLRLRALPQPFTMTQARAALGTTRRVAVPLLECLDARGETERLDDTHRRTVPPPPPPPTPPPKTL